MFILFSFFLLFYSLNLQKTHKLLLRSESRYQCIQLSAETLNKIIDQPHRARELATEAEKKLQKIFPAATLSDYPKVGASGLTQPQRKLVFNLLPYFQCGAQTVASHSEGTTLGVFYSESK